MTREAATTTHRNCRRFLISYCFMAVLICGLSMSELEATEYFVAVDHPNASDSNDGLSLDQPFKTLSRAVQAPSSGDTLSIKEGIYREALVSVRSGTADSPIVIRAYPGDEGRVVIRGSDVVKGWTNDGGDVWSVSWQSLPLINYPAGWPNIDEYSRRREMVFVDGNPLEQVLSQAALVSGHFWMDDAAGRIRIHYSGDPNSIRVEISVRTQGVMANGSYHVFRGLRVEHFTTDLFIAAMHLGPHQKVEDCRVEYNNGSGFKADSGLEFIRSTSNHNGRLGIGLNGSNSILESSETSHNSWRYGPRWDAGGIKILGAMPSDNRIVRHTANYNNGIGIWFDTVGSGNVVEASVFEGNVFASLEFEAAAGPNWAINNVIVGTVKVDSSQDTPVDGAGIILYNASDTYIYNNTIVNVGGSGIAIAGNEIYDGLFYIANTQVFNNIIVDSGTAAVNFGWLSGTAVQEPRVGSHHFDNNLYYGNPTTIIFPDVPNIYGVEYWSLSEWQANRGEDLNSLEEVPSFVRPSVGDFSLLVESLAIDAGSDLTDVSEDFLGRPRPQDSGHDIGAYECPLGGGCGYIGGFDFEGGLPLVW